MRIRVLEPFIEFLAFLVIKIWAKQQLIDTGFLSMLLGDLLNLF